MAHSKQAAPHHAKAAAPVAHKAKEVRRKMKAVTQELAETPKMVEAASEQWGSIYQVCARSPSFCWVPSVQWVPGALKVEGSLDSMPPEAVVRVFFFLAPPKYPRTNETPPVQSVCVMSYS
jgi:hypothetical protein